MNPVLRELQNVEFSRVFGPTNSLAGQMVQAERDLARQHQLADRRMQELARMNQSVLTSPVPVEKTLAEDKETVGGLIGLGVLVTIICWPAGMFISSGLLMWQGVPIEAATQVGWWVPPIGMAVLMGLRIVRLLREPGREAPVQGKKQGRPLSRPCAHHQDE